MVTEKNSCIDPFRLIAAFFVVAIHCSPLHSLNETADYLLTYCMGRIGVPFFLMVTGYFILAPCFKLDSCGFLPSTAFRRSQKKTLLLYLGSSLLYLPLNWYAEKLSAFSFPKSLAELLSLLQTGLRILLFDGTFYHLWYLPASLLGCMLLYALLKKLRAQTVLFLTLLLYFLGLLGDSYYGLFADIVPFQIVFDIMFGFSSYTRNGIFFAPVFLLLGALIRKKYSRRPFLLKWSITGFAISLLLLLAEGCLTWSMQLQRHNSMYIFLIPCMFFLFQLLAALPGRSEPLLRQLSLFIYILHPLCIVGIRGIAKVTSLTKYLVENSLLHYLSVCLTSLGLGLLFLAGKKLIKEHIKL